MERGTLTTIHELKTGARFYKKGDKAKQVFEHTGKYDGIKAGQKWYYVDCQKNGEKYPVKLKSDTAVIFLRYAAN